jgi:hypothetical protein
VNKTFYRIWLSIIIVSHHIALLGIISSVPLLILNEPIWISLPLSAWIMHLSFSRVLECPYTRIENYLRRKLGMEEISTFISHYYKKPYHKLMNHHSYPYE